MPSGPEPPRPSVVVTPSPVDPMKPPSTGTKRSAMCGRERRITAHDSNSDTAAQPCDSSVRMMVRASTWAAGMPRELQHRRHQFARDALSKGRHPVLDARRRDPIGVLEQAGVQFLKQAVDPQTQRSGARRPEAGARLRGGRRAIPAHSSTRLCSSSASKPLVVLPMAETTPQASGPRLANNRGDALQRFGRFGSRYRQTS